MYKNRLLIAIVMMVLLGVIGARPQLSSAQVVQLPPGFASRIVVDGLFIPVDMVFLPDNNIFVAQKGVGQGLNGMADIRLVKNGVLNSTPVLTLSVDNLVDSGLNAITIDRDFATNGYFYVWYSIGENAKDWAGTPYVRLSRFTYDFATETAPLESELILLHTSFAGNSHHGHALFMDGDGHLYIASGDSHRHSDELVPFDLELLDGKLLRIRPTEDGYTIPADNPYLNVPNARPEIFALGLRNPYRIAHRESDGLLLLGDVGTGAYEEANVIRNGANYGWPVREGPCLRGESVPCAADPAYQDPIFYYQHTPNVGGAITGIDFYNGTDFPSEYHDKLFFADVATREIGVSDLSGDSYEVFFQGANSYVVDVTYHQGSIYLVNIAQNRIERIFYADTDNVAPTGRLQADVRQGAPALTVNFTADVTDPDDTIFKYRWDMQDGTPTFETNRNQLTHTFTEEGVYNATVTIIDGRGAESLPVQTRISVYGGEFATIDLEILNNPTRTLYQAGDTVRYSAERTNLDGLDPDNPYTWRIDFHHASHVHPFINANDTMSDTVTFPTDSHDGDFNLWYEFVVTMNTVDGIGIETSREIFPQLVELSFETTPPDNGRVQINGVEKQTPTTVTSVVGLENTAVAAPEQLVGQALFAPSYWEYGTSLVVGDTLNLFAPVTDQTYRAVYEFERAAELIFVPTVRR